MRVSFHGLRFSAEVFYVCDVAACVVGKTFSSLAYVSIFEAWNCRPPNCIDVQHWRRLGKVAGLVTSRHLYGANAEYYFTISCGYSNYLCGHSHFAVIHVRYMNRNHRVLYGYAFTQMFVCTLTSPVNKSPVIPFLLPSGKLPYMENCIKRLEVFRTECWPNADPHGSGFSNPIYSLWQMAKSWLRSAHCYKKALNLWIWQFGVPAVEAYSRLLVLRMQF